MSESPRCRMCAHELEREDVRKCPACGYNPRSHRKWEVVDSLVGALCMFTFVLAPIGLWLFMKVRRHRKERERGVAA